MDSNGLNFRMLSQFNDWLPPWRAVTAYLAGQSIIDQNGYIQVAQNAATTNAISPTFSTTIGAYTSDAVLVWRNAGPGAWQANSVYFQGQYILDSNGNLQCAIAVAAAAKSASTQPAWPVALAQTVVDGNITWSCAGPGRTGWVGAPPQIWQANTLFALGQYIIDRNGNLQFAQSVVAKSGATQPKWPLLLGQTTIDNDVTWIVSALGQALGSGAALSAWQGTTAYAMGQSILDSNGNTQTVIAVSGVTGSAPPSWPTAFGESVPDSNVTWYCAGPTQTGLAYCNTTNRLQLRSMRTGIPQVEDFNQATSLVETAPMTLDQFGNYARWDASSGLVMAGGSGAGEVPICAPSAHTVTDVAMGYDGVLYIAVGGTLLMVDRRGRWPNYTLVVSDFNFWRLAALPEGGVLALDRANGQIGKVTGLPLQTGPSDTPDPGILRPCQANPNPPRIISRIALGTSETWVALAVMNPGTQPAQFALISWAQNAATNPTANLRILTESAVVNGPLPLGGVRLPYTAASIGESPGEQKLAIFSTNLNEALIYDLSTAGETLLPAGDTYILAASNVGPFVHGFSLPQQYANASGAQPLMLPLLPLSLNSLASTGATNPCGPAVIDSGTAQAQWHRMFIEAVVPPRCGAVIWLAASDTQSDLFDPTFEWFPHTLGDADTTSIPQALQPGAPAAVWQSIPTEVAFAPTMLNAAPADDTQGLYMALIQRANKAVRILSGRYLGVRIQMNGDGRNTPEIAALRVYAPRFSYVQNYLPEIYREDKFGDAANVDGASTRRDFLERFVDLFESQFTRIEDRVANAYLLMRAESTPDGSLDWLGGWLGIEPDNYPPNRRRARLEATPSLYQWRGTSKAVTQALDVATNGACSRGAIIVIEDFRLRHIFATILGANLAVEDNPLLPGYSGASNSFVGDTLFVGDPSIQAELQALYSTNLNIPGSAQAVQQFYDKLAHRMTVFVHNQVEDINLNMVTNIVEEEKPAHVQASVLVATQPLMIGLASLLGVNTYLAPEPPVNQVTVDSSDVGRYDVVMEMPTLDPRTDNGQAAVGYALPVARIAAPQAIKAGGSILLDGSASTTPSGSALVSYQWVLLNPTS